MSNRTPRLVFAAPASGSGKTMVTCGFLRLCRRRGLDCRSLKCGPDYIDPMFHSYVLGVPGINLDSFFLPPEQVRGLFAEHTAGADLAVIEGVMGYYDGVAGISTQASTYDIAGITDAPVILVVDGKRGSLSLAALIKGFMDFRPAARIRGVILNRTSVMMAEQLRASIEALGVYLVGAIPDNESMSLQSRHLGLVMPKEQDELLERIDFLADRMAEGLDIDWLLRLAGEDAADDAGTGQSGSENGACDGLWETDIRLRGRDGGNYRIAVARDEAFSFYYQENLRLLQAAGADLVAFSPLHDAQLPDEIDAVLLGGGYPELYSKSLSQNQTMLAAIRNAHADGIKIIAECGGFLYLHNTLEGTDGEVYPMAGIIDGEGFRTDRLSRFGYMTLQGAGGEIRGHGFHYWSSTNYGDSYRAVKPLTGRSWMSMHETETLLAGFPHLYYLSNQEFILRFLSDKEA